MHVPGTQLVVRHRWLRGLEGMRVDIANPQKIAFFFPVVHCVFALPSRLEERSPPLAEKVDVKVEKLHIPNSVQS